MSCSFFRETKRTNVPFRVDLERLFGYNEMKGA